MNKELIIALIESFVDEKISNIDLKTPRRGLRGTKGIDGVDGKDGVDGRDGVDGNDGNSFDFEQHKENIEQIILENKNQFIGKRGPKGSPGSDFDFESNKEVISDIILDFFNSSKDDLKLKFSDLSIDDLNGLKLKFSDLTESEIDSLKVYGPRGQRGRTGVAGLNGSDGKPGEKGEPGEKGPRGQRGRTGISGDVGEKGEKGERGERGIQGLPGLTGLSGKNGISGLDGQDAPRIIDIELEKEGKDRIYFTFHFSDGSKIETDSIELPESNIFASWCSSTVSSGAASSSAEFLIVERICKEEIDAYKFVTAINGSDILLAQSDDSLKSVVLGIALESGVIDDQVRVLMFGNLVNAVFSGINLNQPFFLSTDGNISDSIPGTGYVVRLGTSNGDNSGFIKIEEPIGI